MISTTAGEVISYKVFGTRDYLGRSTVQGNSQALLQAKFSHSKAIWGDRPYKENAKLYCRRSCRMQSSQTHKKPFEDQIDPSSKMASSTAGQVITCKAAVAWGPGQPLKIEKVEVAPPQAMEVRIKVHYTALCRTDLVFWEAEGQTPLFPRIFGHEAAGIVESVGEGVTDLKVGDSVLPVFTGECRECRHCKSEESNMCDLLRINTERGVMISDGKSRFSIDGKPVYHFLGTSTFSEYTVVHVGCVAKINPEAPLNKVCILSCGVSTGMGATLNVGKPKKGSTVAIFGLGSVGLGAAEGARIAGASRIIGIDLNSDRYEQAKLFGVTEFINPKDHKKPVQEVIAERTNGGVDCSIECTGNVKAMVQAFESCHDGWGVSVLVGVPHADAVFSTNPVNFLNERTLRGTFFGNYKPRSDLPGLVEMYLNKELELDKFITHEVSFADINKAFDYMIKGESLRTVIKVSD
jgi:alcohol dehydrogenase class-P